jgi:hypothetical protein
VAFVRRWWRRRVGGGDPAEVASSQRRLRPLCSLIGVATSRGEAHRRTDSRRTARQHSIQCLRDAWTTISNVPSDTTVLWFTTLSPSTQGSVRCAKECSKLAPETGASSDQERRPFTLNHHGRACLGKGLCRCKSLAITPTRQDVLVTPIHRVRHRKDQGGGQAGATWSAASEVFPTNAPRWHMSVRVGMSASSNALSPELCHTPLRPMTSIKLKN